MTAFRYASGLEIGLALDLGKLMNARGLVFTVSGDYRAGRDLSQDIGSTLVPAQIFAGDAMRLYQLSLEQSLLDERLSVLACRIGLGDDFFASAIYQNYVQAAFNNNHGSLGLNVPSFSVGPVTTWGWRTRYEYESAYVMSGIYYADDTIGADKKQGLDFSIRSNKGFIFALQIGYKHNQGKSAQGLPGNFAVGSYYDSKEYADLGDSSDGRYGNYGIYFHVDQMLYAEPHTTRQQGVTAFLAATVAPRNDMKTFPYFYVGGMVYGGLFPGRDRDTTALGVAYSQFSGQLEGTYETAFEINHKCQITPWLSLQPDFQYILRPGGTGAISDAIVLGFELAISL